MRHFGVPSLLAAAAAVAALSSPARAQDVASPKGLVPLTPGGLTADQVAHRAATTSYSAASARDALLGAQARVVQAETLFAPRVTVTARYARLSDFTMPAFGGGGSLVGTTAPAGTLNPPSVALPPVQFTNLLDNYYFSGNVLVPVSDYFLRIQHGYRAASKGEEAAQLDALVARARSATDARVVFYAWLRARATVVVAEQALVDQRTHLADVEKLVKVGRAALADEARARTGVANAELGLTDAKSGAAILERQVRIAIHAADDEALAPGEDLSPVPPAMRESLPALLSEARASRLELRSLDASIAALRSQATAARAAMYPSLSLFADAIYSNPNPRYQPPADRWLATWDAGGQLTWSPNDLSIGSAAGRDADAKVRQLMAQRGELRDGIDVEVQKAFEDAVRSDAAIAASDQELASATEAYRVAHAVFLVGQLSSTTLTDVEVELTRARLHVVNSRSDARIARARLSFVLGRETKSP